VRFADFVGSVFSMVDISYDFALRIYEEFGGLRGGGVVGWWGGGVVGSWGSGVGR
jgi:hypothetical protein